MSVSSATGRLSFSMPIDTSLRDLFSDRKNHEPFTGAFDRVRTRDHGTDWKLYILELELS